MENYVYLIIAEADCPLILFEDNKRMSVNIHNKKGAEEQLKLTVSTVNSCFSALSSLKYQKSTTLTP